MAPRIGVPFDVTLPSGVRVTVCAKSRDQKPPSDLATLIDSSGVECSVDLFALPLADANVVEGILAFLGAIGAPPQKIECRNCREEVEVDARAHVQLAPLLMPQGDPELDPKVDEERTYPLPRPLRIGRSRTVTSFVLGRSTLRDVVRLRQLLGAPGTPLPLEASFVRALRLSFDQVASPTAIARALVRLSDDDFDPTYAAIAEAWDAQHYVPRLLAPVPCPKCGARHDLPVPANRPIELFLPRSEVGDGAFPSLEEFRRMALVLAREVMAAAGFSEGSGVEILVDDGVPPCDDGGEPLLGSYTPAPEGEAEALRPTPAPFEIALYFRTFRAMYEDEPYDVEAEIRETLEHELEHHQNHLAGDDPLDDEERAEIVRERTRLVGKRSTPAELVSSVGFLAGDFGRFLRVTWPLWLIALVVFLVMLGSER